MFFSDGVFTFTICSNDKTKVFISRNISFPFNVPLFLKLYVYSNMNKFAYKRTITKSNDINSYQHKEK